MERIHKLINTALVFLALHLFMVNSKLLYYINPDKPEKNDVFSFLNITDEYTVISMISAVVFSVMTALMIKAMKVSDYYMYYIGSYAFLDGVSNLIYYKSKISLDLAPWFYAVYIGWLIISIGITYKLKKVELTLAETVSDLRKMGFKNKAITERLNITQNTLDDIYTGKIN